MDTNLAVKVTENIFAFPLLGYGTQLVYNRNSRTILVCDAGTGAPLKIKADNEDLFFEDFVLVARNMYLDLIEEGLNLCSFFSES